ncbi:MAG: shikimate kinase [Terrisporobacter sp.]
MINIEGAKTKAGIENDEDMNIKSNEIESLFSCNIFFIGFMGVGKTTVSSYLSNLLNMEEIDIDNYIEEKESMTVAEMFKKYGEVYFRKCETKTLIELQEKSNRIISCGGGIVLKDENIDLMRKQGKVVLLTASPQTIYERVRYSNDRPILNNNMNVEFISSLMEKRKDRYLEATDLIINTDDKTIEEVCREIIKKLNK